MRAGRGRRSGRERDERWARVAWSFLVEPADVELTTAIAEHGAVGALARLREGRLHSRRRLDARLARLDVEDLAHAMGVCGVRALVPGDPEWPVGVERLTAPPYCLYVLGEPDLASLIERSVAVVGSRAATDYGQRVASDLGDGLCARGFTVVSGAAFGIDAAAHRGALAAGGPTVAVLACGVDVPYPKAHAGLLHEVSRRGAVVSEVPIGCAPYRSRFLARNRLIAVLTRATVVVEASLRSGSLVTARRAREHHLPVAAVPGPVTSVASAGCHALVREAGAVLVTDAGEVAELAAPIGEHLLDRTPSPREPTDDLDPVTFAVWSALPLRRAATTGAVSVASGVPVATVGRALAVLDAEGLVERVGALWRKAAPARAGLLPWCASSDVQNATEQARPAPEDDE
ncbi:MAG: DNA-processing protein DprA [Dermatophilaceae bacterium]